MCCRYRGFSLLVFSLQQCYMRLEKSCRGPSLARGSHSGQVLLCFSGHRRRPRVLTNHAAREFLLSFEKPDLKVVICKSFCVIWHSRYIYLCKKSHRKSKTYKASQSSGGFSHANEFLEAITLSGWVWQSLRAKAASCKLMTNQKF